MFSSPEEPDQVRIDLPHDLSKEDFMRGYPDIGWGGIDTAWDKLNEGYMEPLNIVGYNYIYERYENDHKNYPQRVIWGSETHALNFYRSWQSVMRNSYVYVCDEKGDRIPYAKDELTCICSGGELMGIFSEDPANEDFYTSEKCHAFDGKAVAVVRAKEQGNVTITVGAKDLKGDLVTVTAK